MSAPQPPAEAQDKWKALIGTWQQRAEAAGYEGIEGALEAAEAQAQGGGEIRAKPLEWQQDGPSEWCDRHHGFHITQDNEEPQEYRFTAEWGESDPERFPTLEEAQAWCQEALDRYIREWAVAAPPSAPVGVDEAAEDAAAIDKAWGRFKAALAKQPAAVDGAMSPQIAREWLLELMGDYDFTLPSDAFSAIVDALAQQPAALAASKAEPAGGEAVDLIPWLYVIRSEFLPDDANLGRESDRKMREALDWATNAMRERAALSAPAVAGEAEGLRGLVDVLPIPDGYEVVEFLPGQWSYEYGPAGGNRMACGTNWNHPALAACAAWEAHADELYAAGAVPEGWMVELVTNIKRAAIRGRNCVGTPDSAVASNLVATCDHIESLADQVLAAAQQEVRP